MVNETLQKRLKEKRKERHCTQSEIATYLGITVSAYGNYELGQRSPTPETLYMLADFFNVSIDYLLGREEHPTTQVINLYTKEETELVNCYRKLNKYGKSALLKSAQSFVETMSETEQETKFKKDIK